MPKYHKLYRNLQDIQRLKLEKNQASNPISLGRKIPKIGGSASRNNANWYIKQEADDDVAVREVVANEFFRLLIPTQPKTRLLFDSSKNRYYVMSKEVVGFTDLKALTKFSNVALGIKNGTYKNAGLISVGCLYLNEIDLRYNGNVGIDIDNNIVKLDGGYSFASLQSYHTTHNVTAKDIASLPYLHIDEPLNYKPHNWFDFIHNGTLGTSSVCFDRYTVNNDYYRTEVNLGLLRILMIPDAYLSEFVACYVDNMSAPNFIIARSLIEQLITRKQMLKKAALQNPSFKNFMESDEAAQEAEKFTKRLEQFKTYRKNTVKVKDLAIHCDQEFSKLRIEISPEKFKSPVTKISPPVICPPIISVLPLKKPQQIEEHWLKKSWKGLSSGGILGAAVMTTLILLRVIDVATLGLSLPATVLLSIAIVAVSAVICAAIGGVIQAKTNKNDPASNPDTNKPQLKQDNAKDDVTGLIDRFQKAFSLDTSMRKANKPTFNRADTTSNYTSAPILNYKNK